MWSSCGSISDMSVPHNHRTSLCPNLWHLTVTVSEHHSVLISDDSGWQSRSISQSSSLTCQDESHWTSLSTSLWHLRITITDHLSLSISDMCQFHIQTTSLCLNLGCVCSTFTDHPSVPISDVCVPHSHSNLSVSLSNVSGWQLQLLHLFVSVSNVSGWQLQLHHLSVSVSDVTGRRSRSRAQMRDGHWLSPDLWLSHVRDNERWVRQQFD